MRVSFHLFKIGDIYTYLLYALELLVFYLLLTTRELHYN